MSLSHKAWKDDLWKKKLLSKSNVGLTIQIAWTTVRLMSDILTTSTAVIDALGGLSGTVHVTGAKYSTVSMWVTNKRIPARFYLIVTDELTRRGKRVSPSVFGIEEHAA